MATGAVGAAGLLTATPAGWAVGIAAAIIDNQLVLPALLGEDKQEAYTQRLASLPAADQGPGAPRTFVIGRQMRVPVHCVYQSLKAREETAGGGKGGTSVNVRRVFVDALLHLNDRPVLSMDQLIASGKLVLFNDRDLIRITSELMTLSQVTVSSNERLKISLPSDLEPSFKDPFLAKDIVRLKQFTRTSGPTEENINNRLFVVEDITDATPTTGSTITLQTVEGQNITSAEYTGGTVFSPAQVARVDSEAAGPYLQIYKSTDDIYYMYFSVANAPGLSVFHTSTTQDSHQKIINIFQPGDVIMVKNLPGFSPPGFAVRFEVKSYFAEINAIVIKPAGNSSVVQTIMASIADDTHLPRPTDRFFHAYKEAGSDNWTAGLFTTGFEPTEYFNSGSDGQAQPTLLVDEFGAGETSNYRGQATQGLEQMSLSPFGDQLPPNMEAIVTVDDYMTLGQALEALIQRGGLLNSEINTDQIRQQPFLGTYLRGSAPVSSQIQSVMMAHQLLVQERDGVVAVFDFDKSDVVSLDNGDAFSDLGAADEMQPASIDKVTITDTPQTDLPTSVGVKFQDPDAAYSIGFEHFGLRNPRPAAGATGTRAVDHVKDVNVNLSQVVMQRRQARDLASTMLARAWINRRRFDLELPAAYVYLLENDLVTFTDDDGEVIEARVIRREVGQNYVVKVQALEERSGLRVTGSAVQPMTPVVSQSLPSSTAVVQLDALDMVGFDQASIGGPSLLLTLRSTNIDPLSVATLYESKNGGTYLPVGTFTGSSQELLLDEELTAQDASESYGTTSVSFRSQTVNAILVTPATSGTLATAANQDAVKSGQNWCAIHRPDGSVELAAFETVTTSNGYTVLGSWLRGLRGTSSAACPVGSRVVMLFQATEGLLRRSFQGPPPTTLSYKVVPAGALLADATTANNRQIDISSPSFRNALPLPVRQVFKSYNAATGTRFSLEDGSAVPTHWSRVLTELGTQPPHPMDEPVEEYKIKFYQADASAPFADSALADTALLKADPSTGSPTLRDRFFDYPDARATAAGYTPGSSTYKIGVIQVGQHGDGPEAQFTV